MNGHKIRRDPPEVSASLRVGTAVRSVSGRDGKRIFLVVGMDAANGRAPVVVADGKLRTLERGKHKNPMHLRVVGQLGESETNELTLHPTDGRIAELCEQFDTQKNSSKNSNNA